MQAYLIIPISIILGAVGAILISQFGPAFGLMDVSNDRSSHLISTPRAGGIGIFIAFLVSGFFWFNNISLVILISIAGLLGLAEDRFSLPSKLRLGAQLILSTFLVFQIFGIPSSIASFNLFILWIIFITGTANFYNFMDGIDGIAGLTGIVNFMLFSIFSHYFLKDSNITFLSLTLSSACLGFLLFNFPRAKVFMGDVGSIFLGFTSASLVVMTSSNINIFFCLIMFLCTFYADAMVTLYYRWRRKENLMQAHRSHLYQYMSNELGVSHWKVSLGYAIFQVIFGLLAIVAYRINIVFQVFALATFGVLFVFAYNKIKAVPAKIS